MYIFSSGIDNTPYPRVDTEDKAKMRFVIAFVCPHDYESNGIELEGTQSDKCTVVNEKGVRTRKSKEMCKKCWEKAIAKAKEEKAH